MPDLKMLNSAKYLYKLTLVKCSYVFRKALPALSSTFYILVPALFGMCHDTVFYRDET